VVFVARFEYHTYTFSTKHPSSIVHTSTTMTETDEPLMIPAIISHAKVFLGLKMSQPLEMSIIHESVSEHVPKRQNILSLLYCNC